MSTLNASLLRLKLLDALRSGDISKVDSVISTLQATKPTTQNTDITQIKETILHYAVQVAPLATIQYLVNRAERFHVDINAQDHDGNTPLHLAALSSRSEVVKYLLALPDINDTTVNLDKKQPVELCKDLNIAQLMQFERAKFVEKAATQLRDYFTRKDYDNLERLLVSTPRAAELLDINGSDPETGYTVLHEFILKGDFQMCDWILKHGGDPFKRDKKGKLPIDLIKDRSDPIRKLLKAASKDQTIMDPVVNTSNAIRTGNAPTYKGYLKKWTNFASGYKLRYFVLDANGILSYYTNQDDTNNACRGSLNLGYATLHLDSSEKLKFEIFGKNGIRWHLKANHPIETNRWVWTLQNAITIAKDGIKKKSGTSDADDRIPTSPVSNKGSFEEPESRRHHLLSLGRRKHKRNSSQLSINSQSSYDEDVSSPPSRSSTFKKTEPPKNLAQIDEKLTVANTGSDAISQNSIVDTDNENFDYDMDELDDDEDSEAESSHHATEEEVSTLRRSINVEIASLLELFKNAGHSTESLDLEVCKVGHSTLLIIQELFDKYNNVLAKRDTKVEKKLERQLEINRLWENSIHQLEGEIANREKKLIEYESQKKQLKKYLVQKSGTSSPAGNMPPASDIDKSSPAVSTYPDPVPEKVIEDLLNENSEDEFFDAGAFDEAQNDVVDSNEADDIPRVKDEHTAEAAEAKGGAEQSSIDESGEARGASTGVAGEAADAPQAKEADSVDPKEKVGDDKELDVSTSKNSRALAKSQKVKEEVISEEGSFLGYENPPRKKLDMDEDNRPQVGLWGILKSMIGKDMTRMTLPVSFNECTSLLQRLAEDIEYSPLLDFAAGLDDSTLRLIYVATFATTEYSSTINRIAKPFNPLLGETFEYCSPDNNYRLLVEQVSHHPPISACSAESPKWDYYGENAVDSKFRGRSFDFKHLGKMFCVVRPDNGVIDKHGNKVEDELYSWRKVNTSVVGIMIGNPTVDNYGQMEVTNHTTGDKIVVDMKQRGWRASSAYQLSGTALDAKGNPRWMMGGRWNSKIYAKKFVSGSDANRRLSAVDADAKVGDSPNENGVFLVWQVAPRPKIPFNLTAFAVTLNGLDENLKKWIAPSDTRLRPDQRAMEEGRYDEAADEKHRVEEKQRAARKEREAKKITYKPNWFVKTKHPVTGESFWQFSGKYWKYRKEHKLEGTADIF